MRENYLKIINNYGINNQQRKLQEEIFELHEAIIENETLKERVSNVVELIMMKEHIEEELADCIHVLKQIQYYYKIENEDIEKIIYEKNKRQLERIEKGE